MWCSFSLFFSSVFWVRLILGHILTENSLHFCFQNLPAAKFSVRRGSCEIFTQCWARRSWKEAPRVVAVPEDHDTSLAGEQRGSRGFWSSVEMRRGVGRNSAASERKMAPSPNTEQTVLSQSPSASWRCLYECEIFKITLPVWRVVRWFFWTSWTWITMHCSSWTGITWIPW